ncbi:phytoene desaturase family protein [Nibricoccus sp. IMCC34717]|uniref:phytoene desaturase family protein n=1 Tax=Nibricoccus sp. IMCC34717 TaxID=3034021 RepID=UPI00384A52E1
MNTARHYDVVIIGAGMAGLAAGIRLAHFGKRVCIFERHNAVGGLNGFYSIAGRRYDVGLHAVTNYVAPGVKGTPLGKLLRQLRIERDEWQLAPQLQSRIAFGPQGETSLRFNNDFGLLESEVARQFPAQSDGFRRLVERIRSFDEVSLTAEAASARAVVRSEISDPLLEDMLFCPVMYYGSAQEHDMDFAQFVIMFKALFLEGFARPLGGVRVILRTLLEKYREAGGERRMRCGVKRILLDGDRAVGVELDNGEEIVADVVLSTAGAPETAALLGQAEGVRPPEGALSYAETICVLNREPKEVGLGAETIVFFNDSERFSYERAREAVDLRSGVICLPNNFAYPEDGTLDEGWFRTTCLASYGTWKSYSENEYKTRKEELFPRIQASALRFLPGANAEAVARATVATDMFTPLTVERFTGRRRGAIYGSPVKNRLGATGVTNVHLCGTDQGFLGIIGAMLSGISMANLHVLSKSVRV